VGVRDGKGFYHIAFTNYTNSYQVPHPPTLWVRVKDLMKCGAKRAPLKKGCSGVNETLEGVLLYHVVPKKDGTYKHETNSCKQDGSLADTQGSVKPRHRLSKVDLTNIYFSIPIDWHHKSLLRFQIDDKTYQFNVSHSAYLRHYGSLPRPTNK